MKTLLVKEKRNRKFYFKYAKQTLLLKSIHANSYLPLETRWEAFNALMQFPIRSRSVRLHNRCLVSNRGHGVLQTFQLSRIQLRSHLAQGFFTGMTRASW